MTKINAVCAWNKAQTIAYRSICGISGSVSAIGSSLIILMIFRGKTKLTRTQNRLLLPMCIFDILSSIAQSLSTLPMDTKSNDHCAPGVGARGNHGTCTAQGFFYFLGLVVPGYNAALCIYYAMVIRWKKTDEETKRVEPYLHALAIGPVFVAAIVALCNDLYGNMGVVCFLTNKQFEDISDEIVAKKRKFVYAIALIMCVVFVTIISTIVYTMVAVYSTVKEQEQRMNLYRFERPGAPKRKSKLASTTEDTKVQAYLYVLGFLITYTFPTIAFMIYQIFYQVVPFAIIFLQGMLTPLQGFWNFLIFIRPRFNMATKNYPEMSFWKKLLITVFANSGDNDDGDVRSVKGRGSNTSNMYKTNSLLGAPNSNSRSHNSKSSNSNLRGSQGGNLGESRFPVELDYDSTPCIEESNSYCTDISHPAPPPVGNPDTVSLSKDDYNNDNDHNDTFGPLSKLVAQDLFGTIILPRTNRRRSMVDFRLTAMDRNCAGDGKSEFLGIACDEEVGYENSNNFHDKKLLAGGSQQQRRSSCPSLSFSWKEGDQTNEVKKFFGEYDDESIGIATASITPI